MIDPQTAELKNIKFLLILLVLLSPGVAAVLAAAWPVFLAVAGLALVLGLLGLVVVLWALIDTALTSLRQHLAHPLQHLSAAHADALGVGLGLVLLAGIAVAASL